MEESRKTHRHNELKVNDDVGQRGGIETWKTALSKFFRKEFKHPEGRLSTENNKNNILELIEAYDVQ